MEKWNAYTRDGQLTNTILIRGEQIPDGMYHLVCEVLVKHVDGSFLCMKRSKTKPNYPGYYDDDHCIFYSFICTVDCDKDSIQLQENETEGYKWMDEKEFIRFINSDDMIPRKKSRYFNYFMDKKYIHCP